MLYLPRFVAAIAFLLPAAQALPVEDPAPRDYIRVEIRGTLDHGIVSLGGETTGTVIHVGKITWELDLGGNQDLLRRAEELNKKTVLVTGLYSQKKGVEIPIRHLVTVESLQPPGK